MRQLVGQLFDFSDIERNENVAAGIHSLADDVTPVAREQWFGQHQIEVVLLEPALGTHLDHVAKAACGNERGPGTSPLDQGIGGKGRSMDDLIHGGRGDLCLSADPVHPLGNGVFRRGMGRQDLGRVAGTGNLQHHIGEGSADIDGYAVGCVVH